MSEQKVPVEVLSVHTYKYEGMQHQWFVLFQDATQRRFPIWIGYAECCAIAYAMMPEPCERPLTHDAMALLVGAVGGEIDEVWINDLRDEVFYSVLRLHANGEEISLDLRSSDAVAVALGVKCPIYVSGAVMEKATNGYLSWLKEADGGEIVPPISHPEQTQPSVPGAEQPEA